jgi:sugar phosphate isomerase/epimerase
MKLGIFAKTFEGNAPLEVLSSARSAGYDVVQYNMACSGLGALPSSISEEAADAVHAAAVETGVGIASVSATYNMIHPNLAERERGRRSFEAIAGSAHRMGTVLLTVCTGTRDPNDQWRHHPDNRGTAAWRDLCKELSLLLAIAEKNDVFLGVEPELANVVNSAARARELIDTFQSVRIKIVLDPANLFEIESPERQKYLIEDAVGILEDNITLAHAKDRRADGRFATAGKGVLDFSHYLAVLGQSGFSGALIAHGLAADEAADVATFLRAELGDAVIRS